MPYDSPAWRMADRLTGGDLDDIVAQTYAETGSWRGTEQALRDRYGVEVTRVTLAKWYSHLSPTTDTAGAA